MRFSFFSCESARLTHPVYSGGFALFLVGVIGLATIKPGSGKAIIGELLVIFLSSRFRSDLVCAGWTVISGFGTAAP